MGLKRSLDLSLARGQDQLHLQHSQQMFILLVLKAFKCGGFPSSSFSSPCKFLMILGILSSSITTSHIPLLNSTCLSAPSKAVHSSGSICLQFFMRVSSQDVWVPLPSCVSLLTNIPHPPISLSPSVWHPFAPKIISSSFHFHSQEFSP